MVVPAIECSEGVFIMMSSHFKRHEEVPAESTEGPGAEFRAFASRAGIVCKCRSRSWRRHDAELPQCGQIVYDPALPDDLSVTDLENHNLVELGSLAGRREGPPLALLRSGDGQMEHYAIALGDEFVNLLVVVWKGGPGSLDHGADARVSFAQGVRPIVAHEIRCVELGDPIKAPPVPDDVCDLAHQALVMLAHQLLRSGRRETQIGCRNSWLLG